MVGWKAHEPTSYVNWCGHRQDVLPFPMADRCWLFPYEEGEAVVIWWRRPLVLLLFVLLFALLALAGWTAVFVWPF